MKAIWSLIWAGLWIAPFNPSMAHANIGALQTIDPPSITADTNNIAAGQTIVLWAEGCEEGKLIWSDGQVGRYIAATPVESTIYSAKCHEKWEESDESNLVPVTVNRSSEIVDAEYFFDEDPGVGEGTPLTVTPNGVLIESPEIILSGLSEGLHRFYVRVKDGADNWSLTSTKPLLVIGTGSGVSEDIVQAEYYFNEDPGYGLGTQLSVSLDWDDSFQFAIDASTLEAGVNTFYLRVKDNTGKWSLTKRVLFVVMPVFEANAKVIDKVEYFIDINDPGEGNAIDVPITPDSDILATFSFNSGEFSAESHTIYVRVRDDEGFWSPLHAIQFFGPCYENLIFSIAITQENFAYLTSQSITGESKIYGEDTNIRFESKVIELLPGFEVEPGAVFKAVVGGCEN